MYNIKKKDFFFISLFAISILIVTTIILSINKNVKADFIVLLTFTINLLLAFYNLLKSVKKHNFSFDIVLWLFTFFFFCIAPMLQYLTDTYAWNLHPTDVEVFRTNIFVFIWLVSYLFGKKVGNRNKIRLYRTKEPFMSKRKCVERHYYFDHVALTILLVISGIIVIYYLVNIGLTNLLIRSTNTDNQIETKAIGLITNHGFHNTLLFTAVFYILDAKKNGMRFTTILAVLFFLIGCFPTGIARYMMASFYCGMLIIVMDSARKKRWITWAILGGLVIVFPAMSVFRTLATFQTENLGTAIINSIRGTYLSPDYDAHQMFISIQRWAAQDGLTWGKQFLGAILFFVPRSIWPGKAWGTGQSAFEATNQHWFTNVSAPLPAEGYINFGVPGIILLGLVVGYITARLDKKYWKEDNNLSMIRVIYPFSMLMFFFMNRGDLLVTWSFMVAQVLVGIVLYKFIVKKRSTWNICGRLNNAGRK